MRYLTYLKPSGDIKGYLESIGNSSKLFGYHCSLWGFNISDEFEEREIPLLVEKLSKKRFHKFVASTHSLRTSETGTSILDLNGEGIHILHQLMVRILRPYDGNKIVYDEKVRQRGLRNYTPHITLSTPRWIRRINAPEKTLEMEVSSFYLARRDLDGCWNDVGQFDLVESVR